MQHGNGGAAGRVRAKRSCDQRCQGGRCLVPRATTEKGGREEGPPSGRGQSRQGGKGTHTEQRPVVRCSGSRTAAPTWARGEGTPGFWLGWWGHRPAGWRHLGVTRWRIWSSCRKEFTRSDCRSAHVDALLCASGWGPGRGGGSPEAQPLRHQGSPLLDTPTPRGVCPIAPPSQARTCRPTATGRRPGRLIVPGAAEPRPGRLIVPGRPPKATRLRRVSDRPT